MDWNLKPLVGRLMGGYVFYPLSPVVIFWPSIGNH